MSTQDELAEIYEKELKASQVITDQQNDWIIKDGVEEKLKNYEEEGEILREFYC
jgi:hypothetical protein